MISEEGRCAADFEDGGKGHKPREAAPELEQARNQILLPEAPEEVQFS